MLRHFKVNATAATAKSHHTGVLVDSGAIVSLFRDKEFFTKWDESFNSTEFSVTLADGTNCAEKILGRGTVSFQIHDDMGTPHLMELKDVLYMPSLNYDGIISVPASNELGYEFSFLKNQRHMKTCTGVTVPMKRKKNLYFINAIGNAEVPSKRRSYCEWHQIMGHLNYASMMKMPNHVEGMIMTGKAPNKCHTCIKNKSKMLRNRRADERATKPFQFVHSDVHQPDNITILALGGYKYIRLLYRRLEWIYDCLPNKIQG